MILDLATMQSITKIASQTGINFIRFYPGTIRMELPANEKGWHWVELDRAGAGQWHTRFIGFDGHEIEKAHLEFATETEIINQILK